jgi:hypothetical protein
MPGLMDQERAYLANLRSAASFLAPENGLEILDSTGQRILVFERGLSFPFPIEEIPIATLVISP